MPPSICVRNVVFALVQSVSGASGMADLLFGTLFYYLLHHENMIRKIIYGVLCDTGHDDNGCL